MEKLSWEIISSYYHSNTVVKHQHESYNRFISHGAQKIVDQEGVISLPNYKAVFGKITFEKPQIVEDNREVRLIYPMDARRRDYNYDTSIYCDITEFHYENGEKIRTTPHLRVFLGRIPVMVKSEICNLHRLSKREILEKGECEADPGGYFIIRGNERVLVGQLRAKLNHIYVLRSKKEKIKLYSECRSMSNETGHSVLLQAILGVDDRTLVFSLPYIKEKTIPVGILFQAMGFNDEEIVKLLQLDPKAKKYEKYILRDAKICKDSEDAIAFIAKYTAKLLHLPEKRIAYAKQIVEFDILPHLGVTGSRLMRGIFMAKMVRKLLHTAVGLRKEDDRDNYSNKRVDIAGTLIQEIFRNIFKKYVSYIYNQLEKRKQQQDILSVVTRSKIVTKLFNQCFATGNWVVQKNASYFRTGVSQIMDRITYMSSISHLRRVLIQVGKEGKNTAIRQIHPSQFGYIDIVETPEGAKVGIVLNFALFCDVTREVPTVYVKSVLEKCTSFTHFSELPNFEAIPITLNDVIYGYTTQPENVLKELYGKRMNGELDYQVTFVYDPVDKELRIESDEGRFIRPVLKLDDNVPRIVREGGVVQRWDEMVKKGWIQYVDPLEIENSVVAMDWKALNLQKSDFMEIHPVSMLGVISATLPFPEHTQSPRNAFATNMGKQALGTPVTNPKLRTDTVLHTMFYPQRPIVSTRLSDFLNYNAMPCGINAVVAIFPFEGWNQEDSAVVNGMAIERGLFATTTFHTYDCSEKKRETHSFEKICVPPVNSESSIKEGMPGFFRRRNGNYNLLDKTGVIRERSFTGEQMIVKKGDVLVGKVIVNSGKNGEESYIDASRVVQSGEEGIVDRVVDCVTPAGHRLVKVIIKNVKFPVIGDKIAPRSAQKNTIGRVARQEDLPFSPKTGMVPDIIINPLCMGGRMTINQLIECVLGKNCVFTGHYGDASPFTEFSDNVANKVVYGNENGDFTDMIESELKKRGFNSMGWEEMYNGMTGERIQAKVYMGPTFYQRLKHLVDYKLHARAQGNMTTLSRQPLEGRARDGGLRFGEMERDCMISHGTSRVLLERLCEVSDEFKMPLCDVCGTVTGNTVECHKCKSDKVKMCTVPYAFKLLSQELQSLGIEIGMKPGDK